MKYLTIFTISRGQSHVDLNNLTRTRLADGFVFPTRLLYCNWTGQAGAKNVCFRVEQQNRRLSRRNNNTVKRVVV